jgi:hypothetical protein
MRNLTRIKPDQAQRIAVNIAKYLKYEAAPTRGLLTSGMVSGLNLRSPRTVLNFTIPSSTAHAKGAIGRLDFHFSVVLSARAEPECATCSLNDCAAGTFVWIIHKLIEPNL